jgi:hypothetical protein
LRDSIDVLMHIEERVKQIAERGYSLLQEQDRQESPSPSAI